MHSVPPPLIIAYLTQILFDHTDKPVRADGSGVLTDVPSEFPIFDHGYTLLQDVQVTGDLDSWGWRTQAGSPLSSYLLDIYNGLGPTHWGSICQLLASAVCCILPQFIIGNMYTRIVDSCSSAIFSLCCSTKSAFRA